MSDDALRIAFAELPGFGDVATGLPVRIAWAGTHLRGLYLGATPGSHVGPYAVLVDDGYVGIAGWDGLSVNLADAATRDRVARWCAARLGWPAQTSAPTWMRTLDLDDSAGWCLVGADDRAEVFLACGDVRLPNERALPGLAALDRDDARTLPDGTRWVDAAALAVAARHLGAR